MIIVIILFFAIPTAVFSYLEPTWGILDAFYYCFISLTTIGLGDYIPGDGVSIDNRSLYKMLITAYLVLGKCICICCMRDRKIQTEIYTDNRREREIDLNDHSLVFGG